MTERPFITPQNERSFSGLVDRVITESGRPSSLLSVIQYVNLTVRECQALGLFARDLLEEQVTTTANPHIYTRPRNFRSLRAVKYGDLGYYPKNVRPGRAIQGASAYFYAADDYYAFHGVTVGEVLSLASYYWAKPLQYYGRLGVTTTSYVGGPYSIRPAYFDISSDTWYYLNSGQTAYVTDLGDDAQELSRRQGALNWLIDDWWDLITEGTKAKLFKQFNDDRASASYAAYAQTQTLFRNTMANEAESSSLFGDTV